MSIEPDNCHFLDSLINASDPSGHVIEEDLKNVFCALIYEMKLEDSTQKTFNPLGRKQHSFTFMVSDALQTLESLCLEVELPTTKITMTYRVKKDVGISFMRKFFNARMLHCPTNRTRTTIKETTVLQPTPKGVALLQEFCNSIGIRREKTPPIVKSNFNSMELFKFDRDIMTDKVCYSDYFFHLLFAKIMGDEPNIWTAESGPDPFPSMETKTASDDSFAFDISDIDIDSSFIPMGNERLKESMLAFSNSSKPPKMSSKKSSSSQFELQTSPFYHRYFTNPESDSHVQYYSSTRGVRMHKNVVFRENGENVMLAYCISGKAICQWLIDCTDLFNFTQAIEISSLFVKFNFLKPVLLPPSTAEADRVCNLRDAFYVLTSWGEQVANWRRFAAMKPEIDVLSNSIFESVNYQKFSKESLESFDTKKNQDNSEYSASANLLLKAVLKDPGMRYLFKKHLEQEFCAENLEAYMKLKQYEKQISTLGKILLQKRYNSGSNLNRKIVKVAEACLSTAYSIYFNYISNDAPYVININYVLRSKITSIILPKSTAESPISPFLPETAKSLPLANLNNIKINFSPITEEQILSAIELPTSTAKGETTTYGCDLRNDSEKSLNSPQIDLSSPIQSSPMEESVIRTLDTLAQTTDIFHDIRSHIYRLMEVDSFPKFITSDLFQNTCANIVFVVK